VLGFEGLDQSHLLAGPAAALVSTVLERAEACQNATRAEDAARTETLRTVILDALAHEFKTPLATILTAAGGIRAAGPLLNQQDELAEMIENEAERLGQLSSRLLRLARIGNGEVRLQCDWFDVDTEVQEVIERFPAESRRRILFANQGTRRELSADVELFQLAISQLLDNACKYSPPDSTVEVSMGDNQRFLWIQVSNCGTPILPSEQSLIFERFFRGKDGQKLAGTGLGLYVARKIALAHGGSLDLVPAQPVRQDVTFRLAFPIRGELRGIAA
jgi:two-component system sensor histidine kinase KdpD